jgi:hypothetical protein
MRKWLALCAGLGLFGAARAQEGDAPPSNKMGPSSMKSGMADEPKKHLSEVDLYLRDAINNTKVMYNDTQMRPGKLDSVIEKENLTNLDKSLSSALTHVQHIKSMPEAHVADMGKIDQLSHDLTQARGMIPELRAAMHEKDLFASLSSQLYTKLKDADDTFNAICDKQGLTRVDKLSVPEKQPVKGVGEEPMAPPKSGEEPMAPPSKGEMPRHHPMEQAPQPSPSGNY